VFVQYSPQVVGLPGEPSHSKPVLPHGVSGETAFPQGAGEHTQAGHNGPAIASLWSAIVRPETANTNATPKKRI